MKAWTDMAPRERDAAIAERVMGWDFSGPDAYEARSIVPHYTTDPVACRLVEDEIERRGLLINCLYQLYDMLGKLVMYEDYIGIKDVAVMLRATPEQRCHAAMIAIESSTL